MQVRMVGKNFHPSPGFAGPRQPAYYPDFLGPTLKMFVKSLTEESPGPAHRGASCPESHRRDGSASAQMRKWVRAAVVLVESVKVDNSTSFDVGAQGPMLAALFSKPGTAPRGPRRGKEPRHPGPLAGSELSSHGRNRGCATFF